MIRNYHTHTHFCGHAIGNSWDYTKEAIAQGLQVIGISDHAPLDTVKEPHVRMLESEFMNYIADIEAAQVLAKGQITVLKAVEVEFFYDHDEYYNYLRSHVDYLIHGQHYINENKGMDDLISGFALRTKEEIYCYRDYLISAMESGYFDIFAHPDLYLCGYKVFDEAAEEIAHQLCQKALETNSVFEYNANGYRRGSAITPLGPQPQYPRQEFWNIVKQYNVKTILNSDCHNPKFIYDDIIKQAEADYLKLDLNDIGELPLK